LRVTLIDNVFASLWWEIGMKTILSRAGFNKRSGTPISDVIFGLMCWRRLKINQGELRCSVLQRIGLVDQTELVLNPFFS
jgi:hypothetical protein